MAKRRKIKLREGKVKEGDKEGSKVEEGDKEIMLNEKREIKYSGIKVREAKVEE